MISFLLELFDWSMNWNINKADMNNRHRVGDHERYDEIVVVIRLFIHVFNHESCTFNPSSLSTVWCTVCTIYNVTLELAVTLQFEVL